MKYHIDIICLAAKGLTPTFFPHFLPLTVSGEHRSARVTSYNQRWNFNVFSRKPSSAKGFRFCSGAKGHNGHIAILTETDNGGYRLLYADEVAEGLDDELFTTEMVARKNSHDRYEHGNAVGLAVAAQDDKVALVQNSPAGDPKLGLRNPDLECAVIDKTGVIYNGLLKSSLVDIDYGSTEEDIKAIEDLAGGSMVKNVIKPVSNKNRVEWKAD